MSSAHLFTGAAEAVFFAVIEGQDGRAEASEEDNYVPD
jgi:hypothetical protein